jgi:phosphoribosylanthranilate isomerase
LGQPLLNTRLARVKICGIKTAAAAAQAAVAGADAIGLVFYPSSPRHLADLGLAREIAQAAGPLLTVVGLFVDPEEAVVAEVLRRVPLGALQFHGNESEGFCRGFDRPYIKALRMIPGADIAGRGEEYKSASGLLLDAYRPGTPGGTGEVFDWGTIPAGLSRPLILAGGLNPDNVAQAVQKVRPWAVDVSGGIESAPGVKDPQRVANFISRAKSIRIPFTDE